MIYSSVLTSLPTCSKILKPPGSNCRYEESQSYMDGIKKSRKELRVREEKRKRDEADFTKGQEGEDQV